MNSSDSRRPSRFAQYTSGDLPPLVKPDVGDGFTGRLVGEHEYTTDDRTLPVLDFEDGDGGRFSWMVSAWHALDQLALADPPPGALLEIRRLPDKGRSHQFRIRTINAQEGGSDELPF
jgi:hypothetical protein